MAPLPNNLFSLLRAIASGYELHWRWGKGWTLEASHALLQQWINNGEIG